MKLPRIISAGAGSGKTFRITDELFLLLTRKDPVRPSGIIATTFTNKAAGELKLRVRKKLLDARRPDLAKEINAAQIGTVNSVCGTLLSRFSYEAGLSPDLTVMGEEDEHILFRQALDRVLESEKAGRMHAFSRRFGFHRNFGGGGWTEDVKRITSLARANNIKFRDLAGCAEQSWSFISNHLPEPRETENWEEQLADAAEAAVGLIDTQADTTKATGNYISFLKESLNTLRSGEPMEWGQLIKLAENSPAKKSLHAAEELKSLAGLYESNPLLHSEIREFIFLIFGLAEEVLTEYARFKEERGLIDFVDQEERVLALLDIPEVRERLSGELDCVIVDEFQDTSPIQLAIFMKLIQLAGTAVWVGDPKQSIYGFRGADPELMAAVMRRTGLVGEGDILGSSYRSRPGIVHWCNAFFSEAFRKEYPEDQITLKPERKEIENFSPPVTRWLFTPEKKCTNETYFHALAEQIGEFISSPPYIEDPKTGTVRSVRPSDTALLLSTHAECRNAVAALRASGIETSYPGEGLLEAPEAVLLLACLRLITDPEETLAKAELIILADEKPDVEACLKDRLDNLQSSWGTEHPWYGILMKIREELFSSGPEAVLDRILFSLDLYNHVSKWGKGEQRRGNLDTFRRLCREYTGHCRTFHTAATLSGFIRRLREIADAGDDTQAAVQSGNAVTVCTYHSAKGLEWPTVIAGSLEKEAKSSIFGAAVTGTGDEFDPLDPLSGRRIRYVFNPFNPKRSALQFLKRLDESETAERERDIQKREHARMLYVGLTRARDYLILPVRQDKGCTWLKEAYGGPVDPEGILERDGSRVETKTIIIEVKNADEDAQPRQESSTPRITVLRNLEGRKEFKPYLITPSAGTEDAAEGSAEDVVCYGSPCTAPAEIPAENLGNSVHSWMLLPPERAEQKMKDIFAAFGIADGEFLKILAENRRLFEAYLQKSFTPSAEHREYPLRMQTGGRLVSGQADLVLKTETGAVIIDHKTFTGGDAALKEKARTFARQLGWYKKIIESAGGRGDAGMYINFICAGRLVEVGV